ncbi:MULTISPECIES: hypothetical protein [unclassified Vibrio]
MRCDMLTPQYTTCW